MTNPVNAKTSTLLAMEPEQLLEYFRDEVTLCLPDNIDTPETRKQATAEMNKAAAYICYFKELEGIAKNRKRAQKRRGCSQEESDRLLGIEEVCEAYKRICETMYDAITKNMTMKRLMLDEVKLLGKTT